jgi:copper chaperone CopZ
MKKLLLICVLFLNFQDLKAQTYSYTFQGVTTAEEVSKIKDEVSKLPQVKSCKINYKTEREAGEIIYQIQLLPMNGENDPNTFSFLLVKQILAEHNLTALVNNKFLN